MIASGFFSRPAFRAALVICLVAGPANMREILLAQCSCTEIEQIVNGKHKIILRPGTPYETFFMESSGTWTSMFQGTNVEVYVGQPSNVPEVVPIIDAYVDPNMVQSDPWAQTYDGHLRINPKALLESDTFMKWLISHEIGEALGFGHNENCGSSVMKAIQPGDVTTQTPTLPSSSERCGVEQRLNDYLPPPPPTRRDDDGDNYSPDDSWSTGYYEPEWCDADPDSNPGYVPTCDIGSGQDRNCDGWDDLSQCDSPIVIDVEGDGIRLTDAERGVSFDLDGDGGAAPLSWTAEGTDDSWLVLDRNGNGTIDDGTEMFGNFTPQPLTPAPNGFVALAVFDSNGDRWVDRNDVGFERLRLWNDMNHDGVSQPGELSTLLGRGLLRISISYKETRRRDRHGNFFRYQARVVGEPGQIGSLAWDVYLMKLPSWGVQASVAPRASVVPQTLR